MDVLILFKVLLLLNSHVSNLNGKKERKKRHPLPKVLIDLGTLFQEKLRNSRLSVASSITRRYYLIHFELLSKFIIT